MSTTYKLIFFVPEEHVEAVKLAVFAAGTGKQGDYEQCCWQVLGQGQFRPMAGSQPYIGDVGKVKTVAEYRVELLCDAEYIEAAVKALKQAHPYEEPAYDVIALQCF